MTAHSQAIALAAAAGALALVFAASAAHAQVNVPKPSYKFEKCFGIAKAGMNDCFSPVHACGGTAKADNERAAWVYVPAGVCKKITGGHLSPDGEG